VAGKLQVAPPLAAVTPIRGGDDRSFSLGRPVDFDEGALLEEDTRLSRGELTSASATASRRSTRKA
jgi:hypothetical protein